MSTEQDIAVPDHTILSRLGKGGMATVYLAREERLGRLVALKVIDERFDGDEHFRKRFEREARTAAGLTHANIVPIYQYGFTEAGRPFLSMAYLEGGSLRDRLRQRGSLPLEEALAITRQVAQGLQAAHARSIVHRDLKPDNVMFQGDTAMLTDFGIAKVLDASTELTSTGVNPGTVKYFSPEQAFERPVDQRSDIYTLGVVLYEMLTGHMPIEADSVVTFMMRIAHQPPEPLPPALRGLQPFMDVLLVKEPERRLQSAAEVVTVIQAMERNWARFGSVDRLTDGIALGAGAPAAQAAAPTPASDGETLLMPTPTPTPAPAPAPAPTPTPAREQAPELLAPTVDIPRAPARPPEIVGGAVQAPRTSAMRWLPAGAAAALVVAGLAWYATRPDAGLPAGEAADVLAAEGVSAPQLASAGDAIANADVAPPGAGIAAAGSSTDARAAVPAVAVQPSAAAPPAPVTTDPAAVPVGDLRVSVNVPASVRVAGILRGDAQPGRPIVVRDVQVGDVEIEVRARGYETQVERVFVASDAPVELAVELQPDVDALLSGRWEGSYGYRDGREPVPMSVDFRVQGGELGGTSTEVNTFGAGAGPLTADLAGNVRGNVVRFVKTYDGSGGQTHAVNYQGVLDANAGRIRGTWNLGQSRGVFSLDRR